MPLVLEVHLAAKVVVVVLVAVELAAKVHDWIELGPCCRKMIQESMLQ